MRDLPKKAFLVSHTHWDREWYQTYHRFRVDLARVVRQVLERLEQQGEFRHFVLDGQAIVCEDHLALHPEDEPRIARLVQAGALAVGPWYVLPDEFLISPEAHVRNLQLGHAVAGRFGPVQPVGYMPDSFGHVAQMPQLLRRAGLGAFVYTRGNGGEIDELGWEYRWRAPDGSEVLAVNQCEGYCNCGGLGLAELWHAHTPRAVDPALAVEQVRALFAKMRARPGGEVALLNNGCDHFPPQRDFDRVIAALRAAFPEVELVHASLADFAAAVEAAAKVDGRALPRFSGELRGGRLHAILSGVWSARMPLKQANDEAQTWLEAVAEPALAYGRFLLGHEWPGGALAAAWKLLLQNHPHDSISGCSTDEVHRDMPARFAGAVQTAERLVQRMLADVAPTFARRPAGDAATVLAVLNPLPEPRSAVVDRLVVLQPPGLDPARLALLDADGARVPLELLACEQLERFWGPDYRTELSFERQAADFATCRAELGARVLRPASERATSDQLLHLRFPAESLPALGHACFYLTEAPSAGGSAPAAAPPSVARAAASGSVLANRFVEVAVHADGTFDLLDKRTGQAFAGLNRLEDSGDAGDEYDHAPCVRPMSVMTDEAEGERRVLERGPWRAAIEVERVLSLPARLAPDRRARSPERVACRAVTRIALDPFSPVVDVDTAFENKACDHRLRAEFPTGVAADEVISDGHFYANARAVEVADEPDWAQPPSGTLPQQEFSLVQQPGRGLAVLNRGLPEIAARRDADGTVRLCLTLLRSVGWLSRDDFDARRRKHAGPMLPTPGAQCLGPQRFRYAVLAFTGDWIEADVKGASRRWRVPLAVVQGVEDGHVAGGVGLVRRSTARTSITAVKRHAERDTLVVRLYNLTGERVHETLALGRDARAAWRMDLLERREAALQPRGRELALELGAHEILTVEVELA